MIVRDDTPEKVAAGLAIREVAENKDDLIREFWAWRARMPFEMPLDHALESWALKRWTSPLPIVALGMLHYEAKQAERHGPPFERRAKVPKRNMGEPILDYLHRIAEANGWLKDGAKLPKAMPEVRLPYKDAREPGEDG